MNRKELYRGFSEQEKGLFI